MKPSLCATYYPFTFIPPSLVEAMSQLFQHLVVYHPAYFTPQEELLPWMQSGLVDVRTPFEKHINETALHRALRELKEFAILHQHSDISLLKTLGNSIALVTPEVPNIASCIRETAPRGSKVSENGEFIWQVFLHLAHDYDKDLWELRQQLNRINEQYQALQSFFCQDQPKDSTDAITTGLAPIAKQDQGGLAIEKRVAAWNRLFQEDPPADSNILFTDSQQALNYLLDRVQHRIEILDMELNCTQPDQGAMKQGDTPWADQLHDAFFTVLSTPLNQTSQEKLVQLGRQIEETLGNNTEPSVEPKDSNLSFRLYLIADQDVAGLLNRVCGVKSSDQDKKATNGKNTLVGIVEEN